MQQRNKKKASLDDFPTPPWATRALCRWIIQNVGGRELHEQTAREPAANRGFMVRPLREFFADVLASDIHDYGVGFPVRDYGFALDSDWEPTDWTISNPPFTLAEDFIKKALGLSAVGVAMILRSAILEGKGRYERLFKDTPPTHVLQFVERVPMVEGEVDPEASSATAYVWLVWVKEDMGQQTQLHWIPPCREQLEEDGDYEAPEGAQGPPAHKSKPKEERND